MLEQLFMRLLGVVSTCRCYLSVCSGASNPLQLRGAAAGADEHETLLEPEGGLEVGAPRYLVRG